MTCRWVRGFVATFLLIAMMSPVAEAGRTGKFTLMALGDNRLGDLDRLRGHYDLLIASWDVKPDVLDTFRKRNPGARVFCYINTSDVNADLARFSYYDRIWNDTNAHEDWFHHDAAGDRVKIYFPKRKKRFAFNKGNPGLQKYLADLVVRTLKSGRYDGVQLDNVMTYFPYEKKLVGRWISAVPVKLTPAQHVADETALLRVIMKAVADAGLAKKEIIFNHMRSGEPDESRAFVAVTDGANCEAWLSFRTPPGAGRWGWTAKVDQVRKVSRAGKITNVLCTTNRMSEDEARFCFASYLLAAEGDRDYFWYGTVYKLSAQRTWYPFYDVDLGRPKGTLTAQGGAFVRAFEKGCVVVNPTGGAVTLTLPGRHFTRGGGAVTKVPLGPKGSAILLATAPVATMKPVTPIKGDEGFGATSRGGTGGRVITVTSLADSGPGTLREACMRPEPRIIQFAVEGKIELKSRIRVTSGRVTIDGSTAPGQGVTLWGHGIQFTEGPDDIILRGLRIRTLSGGSSGNCLLFWGNQGSTCERVLIDHCSLLWATAETVNTWGSVRDVTMQWTVLAEGNTGWMSGVGVDRVTMHHCLFAHNPDRSPKVQGGVYDVVNNVIYNWSNNNATKVTEGARVNLVNNCYVTGPQSVGNRGCVFPAKPGKGTKVFLSGNVTPLSPTGAEDQWPNVTFYEQKDGRWLEHHPAPVTFRADKPFPAAKVTTHTAKDAYDLVLQNAGARVRDAHDLRVIDEVRTRTGRTGRRPPKP